ncbi:hypothetical protein [Solicola sp. PLA-1-18]|uniref:hypothetical protein n=1 Tax=Solicola sp. PLA-1-18 TaxID=3380532 RepID=UPI003B815672
MWDIPVSVRWACWFNAWLEGRVSLDEARDAVVGDDAAHDVLGLEDDATTPLILAWGRLRSRGATGARPVVVEPGDLIGLAGPPSFNGAALDVGEAVVVEGSGLGLVPSVVGAGVFWQVHEARGGAHVPSVAEAERALREQLAHTAGALVELDVARWRPEIADALSELRSSSDPVLPDGYSPRATRVAGLASRCLTIGTLAADVPTGAVSSWEHDQREQHLVALRRAARHALVAAASEPALAR